MLVISPYLFIWKVGISEPREPARVLLGEKEKRRKGEKEEKEKRREGEKKKKEKRRKGGKEKRRKGRRG